METFKYISSADNPQFKYLKKLATAPRERRKSGQTVLDGLHLLHALADAGQTPALLVVREGSQQVEEISAVLHRFHLVVGLVLSSGLFDAIAPVETPTGVLAVFDIPKPGTTAFTSAVLLENIQDPGNLGSIIRTAAAAGCEAIFLSKGCAEAWSPKTLRAGMGAHFVIPVYEQQDLPTVAKQFANVYATSLSATKSIYEIALQVPTAFVFGNEGAGLSAELLSCASQRINIPMSGKVESLNVAAAVAVCLFERWRQINYG